MDGERDWGDGAVSLGERRGHGLASVFGSKTATRAYSKGATRADLNNTEEGEEAEHGEETAPAEEGRVNEGGGKGLG